jgi:hypothetical protein
VLADVLVFSNSNASTWEQLPPAPAMPVEDDMSAEGGWFVTLEGLGPAAFPERLREGALATTDEGLVTRPMSLSELTARVGMLERGLPAHAYPILAER